MQVVSILGQQVVTPAPYKPLLASSKIATRIHKLICSTATVQNTQCIRSRQPVVSSVFGSLSNISHPNPSNFADYNEVPYYVSFFYIFPAKLRLVQGLGSVAAQGMGQGELRPPKATQPPSPNPEKAFTFYVIRYQAYLYSASPTRPRSSSTIICECRMN